MRDERSEMRPVETARYTGRVLVGEQVLVR